MDGDLFKLQHMLGHKTLEMVNRYVKMFAYDVKDNFESYNPLEKLIRKNQYINMKR